MTDGTIIHVGSYGRRGGAGVYVFDWDTDRLVPRRVYVDAPDASWIVQSARTDRVYMVEESEVGRLGVHRFERSGWHRIARVMTHGSQPCYLALDAAERKLVVANYGSGSVAVFDLDDDGMPVGPTAVQAHAGSGPVADRQASAHAHCVVFAPDGALYHVDLGTDEILRHPLRDGAVSNPSVAFTAPPGSGPRHVQFHPRQPFAALVSELASTLTIFELTPQGLCERQVVSTLPPGFSGHNLGGHLRINRAGDRIYVSNRGHDSVAVFAWSDTGECSPMQHLSTEGASPRHFELLSDERFMAVANEEGDNVVLLQVAADGSLAATGRQARVPGPAYVFVAGET